MVILIALKKSIGLKSEEVKLVEESQIINGQKIKITKALSRSQSLVENISNYLIFFF